MIYHMLPGDAQVETFKRSGIEGEILVCREALVEGDFSGNNLNEFFTNRAAFHSESSDPAIYNAAVASQFRKLTEAGDGDQVNLWFEYELFCSVNMWFCIDLLSRSKADVFRVEPINRSAEDRWDGFGGASTDEMRRCFESRIKLTSEDVQLGSSLWQAYKAGNDGQLGKLSNEISTAFPYLSEACKAAIEKDTLPRTVVSQIQADGISNFNEIFLEFRRRAGVFGFGNSQVRRIMEQLN